ncbi:hypothetical protein ABT263_15740 [Kitasatospora sp. NPDC001603]|uniref:hypothetical protein n=1 Tax=Kitasatospora sp. NPDC001603 TaxID=3154388 RepID=UPI00332961B7
MSTNRSRRIDQDTAEHLLGGAVGGPSAGRDASLTGADAGPGRTEPHLPEDGPAGQVARVLAAAAAPATAGELAGEEAALAAFREARLAPAPAVPAVPAPVRRRSMATAALARAFSTKAVAVVLGATALGGVAVAAGTGNLPSPLGGSGELRRGLPAPLTATSAPGAAQGAPDADPSARRTAGAPTGAPSGAASAGGASSVPGPSTGAATPSPGAPSSPPASADARGPQTRAALVALCQGYTDRAGKGERPRLLVADPQFGTLVAAAGGPDKVAEYCGDVLRHKDDDGQGATSPTRPATGSGNGGNGDGGAKKDDGKKDDGKKDDDGKSGSGGKGAVPLPTALPTLPGVVPKPDRSGPLADPSSRR